MFGMNSVKRIIYNHIQRNFFNITSTRHLPMAVKTFAGTVAAGFWRVMLMPIDTAKTILQVEGRTGVAVLREKVHVGGKGLVRKCADCLQGLVCCITAHWLRSQQQ